ncbi:MAG: DUF2207 domain-containing protein [Rhodospirillaceae bacterium]|nr:DUF2207 domain-containing protein [Rhodospirillaceae bacterium]
MPRRILYILAWLAGVCLADTAGATERILRFESAVTIAQNGDLMVTETITVNAEQNQITHGIYRDFPTVRGKTALGKFRTGFDVLEVLHDGKSEPWVTQKIPDGQRVYMGQRHSALRVGQHTFTLRYKTDRQIGFFDDHDELYWNVTGNFWAFPIMEATAAITLPPGASATETASYNGSVGGRGTSGPGEKTREGAAFSAGRVLAPGEGLTIVVAWNKGFVQPPGVRARMTGALRDNGALITLVTGLVLVSAFYLLTWWHYGRDPDAGTIIAEYDPPGISPAACRYVLHMDWDERAFTSAVMNMAAHGYLKMDRLGDGVFTLTKTDLSERDAGLSQGEISIATRLFGRTWTSLPLQREHHKEINSAIGGLRRALEQEHDHIHFVQNKGMLSVGFALSAVAGVGAALLNPDMLIDMILGLSMAAIVAFAYFVVKRGMTVVRKVASFIASAIAFLIVGLIIAGKTLVRHSNAISDAVNTTADISFNAGDIVFVIAMFALAIVNLIFFEIMKAPTAKGRKLMDRIEGFKHYLTVAEKDRLNFHNPPELTPARFEAYLPFAVALDVENDWGDQFHKAMARAAAEHGKTWDEDAYSPGWYHGDRGGWFGRGSSWSSVSSALAQSVSSAAVAPSQASGLGSGLGGGGFSGGGGGGGGGGGW